MSSPLLFDPAAAVAAAVTGENRANSPMSTSQLESAYSPSKLDSSSQCVDPRTSLRRFRRRKPTKWLDTVSEPPEHVTSKQLKEEATEVWNKRGRRKAKRGGVEIQRRRA
ncbi:hypothetical protein NL676_039771 [Syzygium grande]|nr:hypothetical protein NL676_039771 [Syzygium grande]